MYVSSGAICVAQDVADAVNSGHIRGYGGDVWEQQPGKLLFAVM
jgi:lactate dehydrogenase-like 2-hydroxyacid dehydrogenase